MIQQLDAAKAASLVKQQAINLHGNLANFSFKLLKVEPNDRKDVWKVDCEFLASSADPEPNHYVYKVNVATGAVEDIQKLG